jgi:hemerythrin
MLIVWSDDMSVGVELIDEQHKELFARINRLLAGLGEVGSGAELAKTMAFLQDYVVLHFDAEEEQMTQYDYPFYREHKDAHVWLIKEVSEMAKQLAADGPSEGLYVRAEKTLVDWFLSHVRKTDMKMGSFLKGKLEQLPS